jgi:hypothetical protein
MKRNVVVLTKFIAEMGLDMLAQQQGMQFPAEDDLQRGMIEMLDTRKLPVWLVFVSQVFLDIRDILEADVDRVQDELIATGGRIRAILDDFHDNAPTVNQPEDCLRVLQRTGLEVKRWFENDVIGLDIRNRFHANA